MTDSPARCCERPLVVGRTGHAQVTGWCMEELHHRHVGVTAANTVGATPMVSAAIAAAGRDWDSMRS